jgi:hypothetical protein
MRPAKGTTIALTVKKIMADGKRRKAMGKGKAVDLFLILCNKKKNAPSRKHS